MACPTGAYTLSGRDGELRIYDGSNNYVTVKFEQMDLVGPIARARPLDPVVVTVEGYVHAPTGPDYDETLYGPLPVEFSLIVNTQDFHTKVLPALCNPNLDSPWRVGNTTWTTTKGRGSIIMFDGTYYATQSFDDTKKVTVCFESLWRSPVNGSVFAMQWDEVYVQPQNISINELPDNVGVRISALTYGNIRPISAFTSGTPS